MKRWTIEDLEKTTDLKFAACILNERREGLNPYTPLSQKLEKSEFQDLYSKGILALDGSGRAKIDKTVIYQGAIL